jgi:hypothetical protein
VDIQDSFRDPFMAVIGHLDNPKHDLKRGESET